MFNMVHFLSKLDRMLRYWWYGTVSSTDTVYYGGDSGRGRTKGRRDRKERAGVLQGGDREVGGGGGR